MRNKWQPSVLLQWLLIRPLMEKAAAKYEVLPLRKFSQRITVRRLTILACWKDAENGTFALGSHAGILDYCKENDITFYSYMVLEQGALTGRYNEENLFPAGTGRSDSYNPHLKKLGDEIGISTLREWEKEM